MKVAYLIGSLNRGGAETLLLDIFRKADKAPFEMMLIHRKGGMYEQEFMHLTKACVRMAPRRGKLLAYLWQLRRIILQKKITIIHSYFWLDTIYAWLATIGLDIPIMHTFHGYEGSMVGLFHSIRYQFVMHLAQKLCFVSMEQMNRFILRYGNTIKKKGVVLYNGLSSEKFDASEPQVENHESSVKLCMVGNFNSVRSQKVIVEAIKSIDNSQEWRERLEFYFIGGRYKGEECYYDECVAYCKQQGLNNVHFLGVRDDVPAILKSMDGFVYSSRNDTFGIAVIEAIASGLPIVVNDYPVMREVCGKSNEGIRYFITEDANDAAAQIMSMMANMKESKIQAKKNAVAVRNKYSIESHINNVYKIYSSL